MGAAAPTTGRRGAWFPARGLDVVARAGDELAPTACLFLTHLTTADVGPKDDRFRLVASA